MNITDEEIEAVIAYIIDLGVSREICSEAAAVSMRELIERMK